MTARRALGLDGHSLAGTDHLAGRSSHRDGARVQVMGWDIRETGSPADRLTTVRCQLAQEQRWQGMEQKVAARLVRVDEVEEQLIRSSERGTPRTRVSIPAAVPSGPEQPTSESHSRPSLVTYCPCQTTIRWPTLLARAYV